MELMAHSSLILDILCVGLLIVLCFEYGRKGLIATVVQLCGTLISIIGANMISRRVAPLVFEHFLRVPFQDKLTAVIAEQGQFDLTTFAEQMVGFLPDSWSDRLLESLSGTLAVELTGNAAHMAQIVTEQVIAPLFIPVLMVILFFIVFTILRVAVSLLVRWCEAVNYIPVIGGANRLLGFVAGFVTGVVDIYLMLCALWGVMALTANELAFLNESMFATSHVYHLFQQYNPFL